MIIKSAQPFPTCPSVSILDSTNITMNLNTKILVGAAVAVLATTVAAITTVYQLSSRNRVKELREQMSSVIQQSESVASNMDYMHKNEAFDKAGLVAKAKQQIGTRSLKEAYADTSFYATIPVVAAWKTVEDSAKRYGYTFLTPSKPGIPARNPRNSNGAEFADAFKAFEKGEKEFFLHDKAKNELVLARPVHLTSSCLGCHGDPQKSASADGKDILGFPMENLKVDDIKGAFVLKAPLANDPVVAATMQTMALVGGLVLCVVLFGFYLFSRRAIVRPLNAAIDQIDTATGQTGAAAGQIASASTMLAEGASEQAASLEETSASLEEMASMTKRNADSAQNAKALAAQTRAVADIGATDMGEMKNAMNEIKVSSSEVAKIVKDIDEIAFQTNILALNAAVEAARAGEAGAGFAVVADEVRNLAQRSAKSAKETAAKIEDAIAKSERGVQISGKVAASLQEIVAKVREVDELIAGIATASSEQSQGISQVNTAVTQMDKVTQGNAANAEESASAAEELNAQAAALKEAVIELQRLMGADVQAAHPAPAVRASKEISSGFARNGRSPARQSSKSPLQSGMPKRNDNGRHAPALAGGGGDSLPLPSDDEFKNF